ncbi:kinase-like protein, partial [Coprinopsis marcescibilis]
YIHSIGIIHRDIKPENYVLDFNDNVLLTDFGFAFVTQEEGPLDHNAAYDFFNCGTSLYKAPEVEVNEWPRFIAYTPAVDFYSLGCVMLSVAIEHKS